MNSQEPTCKRQTMTPMLVRRATMTMTKQARLLTLSILRPALWSVVLLALPSASFAQSVLLDDAHTSTAPKSMDSNFGTNPNLFVNDAGNVYIKFKFSSTLPTGTPGSAVQRATLKLYLANVTTPGKLDVYAVAGPWDEATVTARNAPPLGSLLTTTTVIGLEKRHEFLVVDITILVRQWLGDDGQGTNGIPNYGLAIVAHPPDAATPEAANITFDSKENSQTSHEAQLNLYLQSSAGLEVVKHDASLKGEGTSALPLGVAVGGINNTHLANDAVTSEKIADNAVTMSELADGSVTSPKITAPLSLTSADAGFTLSVSNTGPGAAITANGAINTTSQYNIGGNRVLSVSGNQFLPNSNIFAGVGAGSANTTGFRNAFFGSNAGLSNTEANDNAFFGSEAGRQTTTGGGNSFFGAFAGNNNTTGGGNSFFGNFAGLRNTSGYLNSFFGENSGVNNTSGQENAFFGKDAGVLNATGNRNAFFGQAAGFSTVANQNSFFGSNAGNANTTGENNVFAGYFTGTNNKTGSNNTVLGANANVGADNLAHATAIGADAVVSTSNTVVLGRSADTVQVPGALNVAGTFGANILDAAAQFNLGGNRVLSIGGSQADPNSNLFAGVGAGASNPTGVGNSFFGPNAGSSTTQGNRNAFFGLAAGFNNNTGDSNSFFGHLAGFSNKAGGSNSFFGQGAGLSNTTGSSNAFFGNGAGGFTTTGLFNTFVGSAAGANNSTGNSNTVIGAFANLGTSNLVNAAAIGAFALVNTSDTIVIGKTAGNYFGVVRPADTVQIPGALNVAGAFGANILDAATQFNIGGNRVLTVSGNQELPNSNIFAGVGAGASNIGIGNSFFGRNAGLNNTGGGSNSFFGIDSGRSNTTGTGNAFFGDTAGLSNTTGGSNSFLGVLAGGSTTTGSLNTFVGRFAGVNNTTGGSNSFFGADAGNLSATGANNTFIGSEAGFFTANPVGNNNTLLGANTVVQSGVSNSSAIGHRAQVSQSNSLVLGGISDVNGGTNTNVGIGTTAPKTKLHLTGGKIYVEANGQGIILKSPGGACFELTVTDAGALTTTPVACP